MATIEWASDSDSEDEYTQQETTDIPRKLTTEEIEGIVAGLRFCLKHNPVQENIIQIHQKKTRMKLSTVELRPSKIPELKKIIIQQFYSSIVACGEAVGVNAAQCIGEPTTQMSNLRSDQVIVFSERSGEFFRGPIGDFVDEMMEEYEITDLGSGSEVTYLEDDDDKHFVLTVNPENEKCEWKPLCEVSRHPANGQLAQVTTKSGRKVTTTLTHSHLQRTADGKIIPVLAKDLKVGDFIPVAKRIPHHEHISTIEIGEEEAELDFDLGWFFGAYLAEGCAQGNTIKITNQSEYFETRCKDICERFDGDYKKIEYTGGFEAGYKGVDHMIRNNNGLGKFTKTEFNTGSAAKRVPGWVYFAPLDFIKGLLRGYFDGDGNVNAERQLIRVHSISRLLIEDISVLLSYFGIFSTLKVEKPNTKNPLYNLVLLRKFAQVFLQEIGSDFPEKRAAMREIIKYNNREDVHSHREDVHSHREDIDRIPMCGQLIADTALPLKLPGYSRNYKRWINKAAVGRETLRSYLILFARESMKKDIDIDANIELIAQAVKSDVVWDEIKSIEKIDVDTLVYDFGVNDNHTFMVNGGVLVHNTLDTFHHTGQSAKNATLGFPRARELFNATKSPSNPTCTVYFTRDNETPEALHKLVDKFPAAIVEDLIVSQDGWKVFEPEDYELVHWHTAWFKMTPDFGDLTEDDWCLRLKFNINKLYDYDMTIKDIAKKLNTIYSDIRCIPSPLNMGIIDVIVNCAEITINGARSKELSDITDDYESRNFYMNKIVSPKIRGQMVCGIPGITKIYRRKAKVNESYGKMPLKKEIQEHLTTEEEWIIDTDGTNLVEVITQPGVDSYRTISNDMWELMNILGIEAARNYLFLEFMNIVSSGGVSINPVHIQVLVDKMTYTGSIRAIARFGVETAQYDPIARATFEEVMSQIITSAMFSEKDHLNGISSNIVLGTKINAGTGRVNFEDIPMRVVRPPESAQRKGSKNASNKSEDSITTPGRAKIRPPTKQTIVSEDI